MVTRLVFLVVLLAGCGATAAPTEVATITVQPTLQPTPAPTTEPTESLYVPEQAPVVDVEALEWVTPTPTRAKPSPSRTVAPRATREWTPEPTPEETVRVPAYTPEQRRWDEVSMTGDPCPMWRQDPLLLWGGAAQGASEVLDSTEWETLVKGKCQ